jgi:transposase-like protein
MTEETMTVTKPRTIRKIYTERFKQNAVDMVLADGMKQAEVAKKLGVHFTVISHWVKKARAKRFAESVEDYLTTGTAVKTVDAFVEEKTESVSTETTDPFDSALDCIERINDPRLLTALERIIRYRHKELS